MCRLPVGSSPAENITTNAVNLQDENLVDKIADLDGNGEVGFSDFLILSSNFGKSDAKPSECDINLDGSVSFADFLLLSRDFGRKSPA